jgi:hypothetical protein
MAICYNPSLSEEPRNHAVKVISSVARESLLSWLENAGRFQSSEDDDFQAHKIPEDLDDFLEAEVYLSDNDEDPLE